MFDVGFSELALTGLIALLVLGPERLPPLVRTTGRWIGRAQRMVRDLRAQIDRDPSIQEFRGLNEVMREQELKQLVTPPPIVNPPASDKQP